MKQYELTKSALGFKTGMTFLEMSDGSYKNSTNTVTLGATIIESSPEFFKRIEDLDLWKPEQYNEAFYSVTPDGGVLKLGWDENRFIQMWQFGNVFRDKNQAEEAAQEISTQLQMYQKKFNEYISKHPKEAEIVQGPNQQATPPVQQMPGGAVLPPNYVPPPPVNFVPPPPPGMPPQQQSPAIVNDPRFAPWARAFTTPGMER